MSLSCRTLRNEKNRGDKNDRTLRTSRPLWCFFQIIKYEGRAKIIVIPSEIRDTEEMLIFWSCQINKSRHKWLKVKIRCAQSIKTASGWRCVRPENILEFYLTRSCVSQADLERFNFIWALILPLQYILKTRLMVKTGEVRNPAISVCNKSLQIRMFLLTQFFQFFYTDQ